MLKLDPKFNMKTFKSYDKNRVMCPGCNEVPNILLSQVRDFEYASSSELYNYYQCETCKNVVIEYHLTDSELSLAYPDDYYSFHLSKNYERYLHSVEGKKFYDSWVANLTAWGKNLSEKFKKSISEFTILDYGSGDGFFLHLLEKAGFTENHLFFYDEFSRHKDSKHFFNLEIIENNIKKFDVIFATHVIEHMHNPEDLFNFANNYLEKNGILIVETPVPGGFQFALTKKTTWGGYHAPRHLLLMRPETIHEISKKFGFSLIENSFQDDSWIWLQTLNNLIKTSAIARWIFKPLQSSFITGSKEKPTALRRRLLKFLSILSKISKRILGETSVIKMVFKK